MADPAPANVGLVTLVAGLALLVACGAPGSAPPPCEPISPPPGDQGLSRDIVWGFADLHAHPAIELAFNGHLIWGKAVDAAPVNGAELPRIAPCPVETHDLDATSPLDRAAGSTVFSTLARTTGFAHGPVWSVSGAPIIDAWPNARDLIHQQMNVGSIRRAYEGGLRLMFASTTDDQLLGALLSGPNFVNGFLPDPAADYESARRQLDMMRDMVAANASWMAIVHSPAEARRRIREGRLAIVLSLEMNGLREADVDALVRDFGVRHILPVHLIDNDVGGTAVSGDIFNSSSAAVSELYRAHVPLRFFDVAATADHGRTLGRPFELGTFTPLPVYVKPLDVPYATYAGLCYEPLQACSGTQAQATSFLEFGQRNQWGLCGVECQDQSGAGVPLVSGVARVRHLMDLGLIVDVSHMSARSLDDTIAIPGREAYPLIASHGDVTHLCGDRPRRGCADDARAPASERSIDADAARAMVRRGGVLGLGTGIGQYAARTRLAARGGPLFTLDPAAGQTRACAAQPGTAGGAAPGCEAVPSVDLASATTPIQTLHLRTSGGISGEGPPARAVVRVELRGPSPRDRYQRHVMIAPLACSTEACSGVIALGSRDGEADPEPSVCAAQTCDADQSCGSTPYTLDDLESVTLQWLYLGCDFDCQAQWGDAVGDRQCSSTWDDPRAPSWTIDEADLSATSAGQPEAQLARLGPRSASPIARLGRTRGSVVLYHRDDRPSAAADVPASGHLLKVSLTSSPDSGALTGASPGSTGENVCVAVRHSVGDACPPSPPPVAGATECPAGWSRLNQRGGWAAGVTLYTFVRSPEDEGTVCGVDLAVLDWDAQSPPLSVDEVRVEAIEDPVGRWVRRYAAISRSVARGRLGAVAFGTDFNGLNGMMDISELPRPADAPTPSACGGLTSPLPLAPLRFRDDDGTLGGEVLLEERGLATYGLLADLVAAVGAYPGCGGDVRESLMLSAEATLRAWESIADPSKTWAPLPQRAFACDDPGAPAP